MQDPDLQLVPQSKTAEPPSENKTKPTEMNEKRDGIIAELLKYLSIRVGMTVK